ncbi:hypothetical protein N601_31730 [Rhodococcus erythropolis DN1]|nr:hypothetical protein N601_31730 [Rhodococcus erythropolis DN1]
MMVWRAGSVLYSQVAILAIPVDPCGGALTGDAHLGGDMGDRTALTPLDQASSSLHG